MGELGGAFSSSVLRLEQQQVWRRTCRGTVAPLTCVLLVPLIRWLFAIVESFDAALIDMNGEHEIEL